LSVNNQEYELHNLRKSLPISSNQTKKKRESRYANESASDSAMPGQGQHQQNGNKMKKNGVSRFSRKFIIWHPREKANPN